MSRSHAKPPEPSPAPAPAGTAASYRLRFRSLLRDGLALVFPCTPDGQVPLDMLSERGRLDYFYARACMGRGFARPTIEIAS